MIFYFSDFKDLTFYYRFIPTILLPYTFFQDGRKAWQQQLWRAGFHGSFLGRLEKDHAFSKREVVLRKPQDEVFLVANLFLGCTSNFFSVVCEVVINEGYLS